MITIKEHVMYYATGKKGHVHKSKHTGQKATENKNVTKVQDFIDKHFVKGNIHD